MKSVSIDCDITIPLYNFPLLRFVGQESGCFEIPLGLKALCCVSGCDIKLIYNSVSSSVVEQMRCLLLSTKKCCNGLTDAAEIKNNLKNRERHAAVRKNVWPV